MLNNNLNSIFTLSEIDKVFNLLVSTNTELKECFDNYLLKEYPTHTTERLYYVDCGLISRFIVDKIKSNQTDSLKDFFIKVEQVLLSCTEEIENLIVVGLFEGIQNIGGREINYYFGFDQWLLPISKKKWDDLIDSWEGSSWRKNKL